MLVIYAEKFMGQIKTMLNSFAAITLRLRKIQIFQMSGQLLVLVRSAVKKSKKANLDITARENAV